MLIEETTENTPITVYHTRGALFAICDVDSEIYFCRVQAAELIVALQHIVDTGEVPE